MGKYSDLVDYSKLDPFKAKALNAFSQTFTNPEQRLNVRVMPGGETSAVFDFLDYDFMLAFNVEGLGTKNVIADSMYNELKEKAGIAEAAKYYSNIGQDAAAMTLTDLVAVGADPIAFADIIGSGDSSWFDEEKFPGRIDALISGYKKAADLAGCAIPQGETPALPGVLNNESLDLAGASVGLIKPKSRFTFGQKITEGDVIYGLKSDGICSNGVSKARKIAESLPDGYHTVMSDGRELGEALLEPTPIYVRHIIGMFEEGADIHYITPITGHGFKKFARARYSFNYVIEEVPEVPLVIEELIRMGHSFDVSDLENYQVWNMGVFIGIIAPAADEEKMKKAAEKHGSELMKLGRVEKGERKVFIKQKDIMY